MQSLFRNYARMHFRPDMALRQGKCSVKLEFDENGIDNSLLILYRKGNYKSPVKIEVK